MLAIEESKSEVAIIGGGPAGLMAAEYLSQAGRSVALFEAMPSVGRKLLRAGVGGLNLSHSEPLEPFINRYGTAADWLRPQIQAFSPEQLRHWAAGLGVETFVGSSGRIFPVGMKAAPLLRAWLRRLQAQGVRLYSRHRWLGWTNQGALHFQTPEGTRQWHSKATLLALGGGSWPKLGSDAAWVPLLEAQGISVSPLKPTNCGFEVAGWSPHLQQQCTGLPLKGVALALVGGPARKGECIITVHGLEGSLIYALSASIRQCIEGTGEARLSLDLLPDRSLAQIQTALEHNRGRQSLSSHLKRQLKLDSAKIALMYECTQPDERQHSARLAHALKNLPLTLVRPRPLAEAISSAGGVTLSALDEGLMLKQRPGLFCAGEMLDWEAPTGGYLLTACLATGRTAAAGIEAWLQAKPQ